LSLLQSERTATPRVASGPQGRCKLCKQNTKNLCKTCNVRLHAERGKQCF
ncbi:hypothetical protein T09_8910, partial [Trichinella sp. T9]